MPSDRAMELAKLIHKLFYYGWKMDHADPDFPGTEEVAVKIDEAVKELWLLAEIAEVYTSESAVKYEVLAAWEPKP